MSKTASNIAPVPESWAVMIDVSTPEQARELVKFFEKARASEGSLSPLYCGLLTSALKKATKISIAKVEL